MTKKASKQSTFLRFFVWPAAFVALLFLAGIAWYILIPTYSPSVTTLDNWVREQNYSAIRPMRSEFIPGTLMHVSTGDRDRMAMAAGDFLGEMRDKLVVNKLPDTTLNVTFSAEGEAGVTAADVRLTSVAGGKGKGGLRAKLTLSNVETLTLTLDKVKDLVLKNKRVQEALRNESDNLFVVLESLRVGKLEFKFEDKVDANLLAKLAEKVFKPSFAGNLSIGADGVVSASTPLVVGASLAKLSSVSKILGGGEQTIELRQFNADELRAYRQTAAARTTRLYSGYEVYALVMGLGNYPIGTPRAGGQLPDAIKTADFVAGTLRQMLPPSQAGRVRVITSEESIAGVYDATKRLNRQAVFAAIDEFVRDVKKTADSTKQTLVMFYYFGHGVADGMSKSVLLVPENFVDDESKSIADFAPRLVDVNEVAKRLSQVTDKVVLLVDACRAHKNEAGQLVQIWKEGLTQQVDLTGILGAVQFASGIYGPHAMVFASQDGVAAPTVPLPEHGMTSGTGPLAAVLSRLYTDVATEGSSLDLGAFLKRLGTPVSMMPGQTSVRGYTFMRQDFIEEFGPTPLLSSASVPVTRRQVRFRPPFDALYSKLGGEHQPPFGTRSGTSVTVLSEIPESIIRGVAVSSDGDQAWILDWEERTHEVGKNGSLQRVDGGLPSHTIAWDRRYGLVLSQWDSAVLYAFASGEWKPIATGVRPYKLMTDGNQELLIYEQGDRPHHRLSVLTSGKLREIAAFDAMDLLDIGKTADGRVWKVGTESISSIPAMPLSSAHAMWRPTYAATEGEWLYLLSEEGRMLFRINAQGRAEQVDLFDVSLGDGYVTSNGTGGLRVISNGFAFVATGTHLLRVDLRQAQWRRVTTTTDNADPANRTHEETGAHNQHAVSIS